MSKPKSPYSAAITGGGFLFDETDRLLPLLMSPDAEDLVRDEARYNRVLLINAQSSRERAIAEIVRRYRAMPAGFWTTYQAWPVDDRKAALFYVILKTYKIVFDFHVKVAMRRWNSAVRTLDHSDLMIEFYEIAARDEFVDSWSETTKRKVSSAYLTMLRKVGMLDDDSQLHPLQCSIFDYFLQMGEGWFLEACLLQPYQIESIKRTLP